MSVEVLKRITEDVKEFDNKEDFIKIIDEGLLTYVSKEELLKLLEPQFKEIKDQFKDITTSINFLLTYHDEYILKLVKELADRVAKLEQFIVTE